ncbi:MAG: AMP-binding protein [Roseinatronobacter sp.]
MQLPAAPSYDVLRADFAWDLPARLNMAQQACFDWAARDPSRVAIIEVVDAQRFDLTYGDLAVRVRGLAGHLTEQGVRAGDRVGVLRSQDGWCAAAHLAIWALGAISVPLFKLFGPDALRVRLGDSGALHVVTDAEGAQMLALFAVEMHIPDACSLPDAALTCADTTPDDPAILIYTSGTTGAPKGALHGHRVLTGHLPGVIVSHDLLGQAGDCLWTPADWAWIGGLFDVAMPGLALGVPVVAARMAKFTPEGAAQIMTLGGVRNVFFPPTALKLLKAADARIARLRSVASGGEPLGAEMLDWGRSALGVTINEFYGQTECNMVASSCGALFPARPGCIGRAAPGFDVAVIDDTGQPTGSEGEIAVRRGAASMMLRYWNNPAATEAKFRGDWLLTGDRGVMEGDYIRFIGRDDDVITSAGYRIGPSEIEDCLLRHPAVAMAAVVGLPDPVRTEAVTAVVVLRDGATATEADLQTHIRIRLSAHLVPRAVLFRDALPMTVTGKIMRKDLKRQLTGASL